MKYVDNLAYLAAPTRNYLSSMARTIINQNLVSRKELLLDYGCGKGSDVRILHEKGYQAYGYDPYYFPNYPTQKADVVSCGFVLNVLTQRSDRLEVVKKCWQLTKSKLIVAAQTGKETNLPLTELRATVEIATGHRATALSKEMFLIDKSNPRIKTFTKAEVEKMCDRAIDEGWVAPAGAFIKGYCTGFGGTKSRFNTHRSFGLFPGKRYYRLAHKQPILPGKSGKLVKNVHLGTNKTSDRYRWAEAGILRRNKIMRMKFHCLDFSFIEEFANCKNWDFLDPNWKPNPDPLGYTRQDRKPDIIRNPNPAVPML